MPLSPGRHRPSSRDTSSRDAGGLTPRDGGYLRRTADSRDRRRGAGRQTKGARHVHRSRNAARHPDHRLADRPPVAPSGRLRCSPRRCRESMPAMSLPVARPSWRSRTVSPRCRTSVGTTVTSRARARSAWLPMSTVTTRSRRFSVTPTQATRLAIRRAGPDRRSVKNRRTGRSSGRCSLGLIPPMTCGYHP